jgi:hypothetical protein
MRGSYEEVEAREKCVVLALSSVPGAYGEQTKHQLRAMASRNSGFQSDVGSSLIRAHF